MEKNTSPNTIEVTVISAEDLLVNRKPPAKRTISVAVRTDPFNSGSTGVDPEGGSYPAWNEKLVMDLPAGARFVTAEVRSGGRIVATARIPVSDFCGGNLPVNYLSFVSYRLRDVGGGGKNGIINLSVKVRGSGKGGCGSGFSRPWMGAAAVDHAAAGGGIVTGIPVSRGYY